MFCLQVLFIGLIVISSFVFGKTEEIAVKKLRCPLCPCANIGYSHETRTCGSDGKTYTDDCDLKCAMKCDPSLKVVSKGPCGKPVLDAVEKKPKNCPQPGCACANIETFSLSGESGVCGSNGKNYGNDCSLECDMKCDPTLKKVEREKCKKKKLPEKCKCSWDCPLIESSVCGSDGKTYSNECLLHCEMVCDPSLKLASRGECTKSVPAVVPAKLPLIQVDCACPEDYKPLCDTFGNQYGNPCDFKCTKEANPGLESGPCPSNSIDF